VRSVTIFHIFRIKTGEEANAGLIEWLKGIPLEELAALNIPAIIPGLNDFMVDEVVNNEGNDDAPIVLGVGTKAKKKKIRVSRGLRGAAEIASATRGALSFPGVRVKEGEGCEVYTNECFKRPVLLPSEVEYFTARRTADLTMALAQDVAHNASKIRWTPLIPVEGVDPTIEEERIEAIESMVVQAQYLARALLQRKGA